MRSAVPRLARAAATLVAVAALVLLPAAAAIAAKGTIAHVEAGDGRIQILVTVPVDADLVLEETTATLGDNELDAVATDTKDLESVRRTTVLAIDTSNSMRRGGRFDAAKDAARLYLDSIPDDIEVGIVTFDSDVREELRPTTDRQAAGEVIDSLETESGTLLYDGVIAAVNAAGHSGQRAVLLLSDGADAGSVATLDEAVEEVEQADTRVDAVSLDLPADQLDPLVEIAEAGGGEVIASTGDELAADFADQAAWLSSQILVTAPLPPDFDQQFGQVDVVIPTVDGGEPVTAGSFSRIEPPSVAPAPLPVVADPTGWVAPDWVLWAGLAATGVGLLAVALLLVPAPPAPMTLADRVTAYSTRTTEPARPAHSRVPTEPVLDQAKAAAAGILRRNRALNDRMVRRLTAAGSAFKASEWLLVHIGVTSLFTALGLALVAGSPVLAVLFIVFGLAAPPAYLRLKAARRRRAFEAVLPEVLQLLAGALSAGLSLPQAVETVVNEGPEPLASEFKRVLVEIRIGVSVEEAFDGIATRFDSEDFRWAVMAIRIQRQVGGNLAELLTTVAATMRERQFLRRHVQALSAEGRLSAIILCALPPVFAIYLYLTNPTFLEPLVATPLGVLLLVGGVVWMAIGAFWMSRMVRVDV